MILVMNIYRVLLVIIGIGILTGLDAFGTPVCSCQLGDADHSDTDTDFNGKNALKCSKNEEYLTCGSACPQTCDDLSYPLPKPLKSCIKTCKTGSFCKQGYYLNDKGECVEPEKCCTGDNEEYTTCGTACPETCQGKSEMCTEQCVSGCFCKSADYVRKDKNPNSPCIKRNQCFSKED